MARDLPNPFHYGGPVTGDQFTGRSDELAAVVSRLENHVSVVLSSPRRYGKSSLIGRSCEILGARRLQPAIVSVNLLRCGTVANLVGALLRGLYVVPGGPWSRLKQTVPAFVHRFRLSPTVQFALDGSPTFTFGPTLGAADAESVIADVYGALGQIGARRPAVLVLDEFQAVTDLDPHLPSLLKALADEHPSVSMVLAGSRHHLMEALVFDRGAPLYNMCQTIALGPIPEADWVPFLAARARAGRKPLADDTVARRLVELAGPVSFDIQQLAFESFLRARTTIDSRAVDAGMAQLIDHEASTYAERFEALSPGQRRVMVALAAPPVASTGSQAFATSVGLADPTSVRKTLSALAQSEHLVRRPEGWRVDDPFFAAWIRSGSGP